MWICVILLIITAVVFYVIGSFLTSCKMQGDIRKLVKVHREEVEKVRMIWYRAGWQDKGLYQKATENLEGSQTHEEVS